MSKTNATEVVHNLITRPRSPSEIQEERQAMQERPQQVVTNGKVLEQPPNPSEAPRVVETFREDVID